MDTRTHVHEETFLVSVEELFAILHTPSAICDWWSASQAIVIAESGGIWVATWGDSTDEPDYTSSATIVEFEAPRKMVLSDYRYHTKMGKLPFEAEFETEFLVEPHESGATLRVTQGGFPAASIADEFYEGCRVGWAATFEGIRRSLSAGGTSSP